MSLAVVRIITACLVSVIGTYLVDDSSGILGIRGEWSVTGVLLSGAWIISACLSVLGILTKNIWGAPLACLFTFSAVAFFSLAIPDDPLIAGTLTFCLSYLGAVSSAYARPPDQRLATQMISRIISHTSTMENWLSKYRRSYGHLLSVAILSSLFVFGFHATDTPWIRLITLLIIATSGLVSLRLLALMYWHGDKTHMALFFLFMVTLSFLLQGVWQGVLSEALIFLYFVGLFFYLTLQTPLLKEARESFQSAPAVFVLMSFAVLVGLGSLFLYLPDAAAPGTTIRLSEAFFTAISAACVTGLSVVDVNQAFSEFGQFVILVLMQVGGLGIMVLSTFAILAFGGKMGVRTERAFSDFIAFKGVKSTYQLIIFIVVSTILIEMVGATILTVGHIKAGMNLVDAASLGVFQAVSAFCNAGFSLTENSLTHLQSSPWMLLCYGTLIILGGFGFVSMFEMARRVLLGSQRGALSVQTKVVLAMTLLLVIGGGVLFALLEWTGALKELHYTDKIINSFFQSITLRTAGFHSVDLSLFGYPSVAIMLFFMFVGGAPGGTAGGVKVTTFATLIATLPTLLRQDNCVRMFSRTFPLNAVAKGSALIILSISTVGVLWFLLLLTQSHLDPVALLFEVFSATGTVGLSLGITDALGLGGQLIIACGMFVGRVGPLTLAIALAVDERSKVEYPSADIMIG